MILPNMSDPKFVEGEELPETRKIDGHFVNAYLPLYGASGMLRAAIISGDEKLIKEEWDFVHDIFLKPIPFYHEYIEGEIARGVLKVAAEYDVAHVSMVDACIARANSLREKILESSSTAEGVNVEDLKKIIIVLDEARWK